MIDNFDIPKKQRLGDILVDRGSITQAQLEQALELQKKENIYIGELLVNCGFIEERDIVVALVVQCNIPYIAIDKYDIDRSIIQLIEPDLAKTKNVIPLDRVGDVLSVVMADPFDSSIKAELQRTTNCRIAPFISTKTEIMKALERWYS